MWLKRFAILLAIAAIAALVAGACGGGGDDGPSGMNPAGNLFANPGFEEGNEPWFAIEGEDRSGFTVTDEFAHSGDYSAYQRMDDPPEASGETSIHYLIQEISPQDFPDVVEGYYRVENWNHGTPRQYLQFVIIAFDPQNFDLSRQNNYQIRYIIGGIDAPPFSLGNARYVFLSRNEPIVGEWTRFSANVREDFERLWGLIPEDFSMLRLLFEVRWDFKTAGDGLARADVYWDDLYIGDAAGALPSAGPDVRLP